METKNYNNEKDKAYKKYKEIGKVHCPYLKTEVVFNSNGFRHLIYKNQYVKRDEKTQLFRFRLLSKAPKLLGLTTTIQEKDSYTSTMEVKEYGKKVRRKKKVQYLGFIAIVDEWKVKVIVKKIGGGKHFFWSIIPNWITNKKRDEGKRYVNFTGDLECD